MDKEIKESYYQISGLGYGGLSVEEIDAKLDEKGNAKGEPTIYYNEVQNLKQKQQENYDLDLFDGVFDKVVDNVQNIVEKGEYKRFLSLLVLQS